MPRRIVLGLLAAALLVGCARENPLFGLDGGTDTEADTDPVAVQTSGGAPGPGDQGTAAGAVEGTADGSADDSADGSTESADGSVDDSADDSADGAGGSAGSSGGGADSDTDAAPPDDSGAVGWDESCRTEAATGPCPFPVDGEVSCIAGPTSPMATGCGDFEERRVTLALTEGGDFIIALLDPGAVLAGPDARLGVVGVAETLRACAGGAPPISGPIIEVSLDASNYDAIITASQPAVTSPFIVRETSTLCPVDDSCCNPDPGVECDDPGLVGCVATLDPFCAAEGWDALCVDLGVAACGAACELT